MIGWSILITTPAFLLIWGGYGLTGLIQYTIVAMKRGKIPASFVWMEGGVHEAWQLMRDHPFQEIFWWVIVHGTIVLFGWWLFKLADRLIWPQGFIARSRSFGVPGIDKFSPPIVALLKLLCGGFALVVSVVGFYTLRTCNTSWHGFIPYWIEWPIVSYRLSGACQLMYQHDWNFDEVNFVLFFASAFFLSLVWLVGGALDLQAVLRYRRIAQGESRLRQVLISAGICIVLIAGLFRIWMVLPAPTVLDGVELSPLLGGSYMADARTAGLHSGWVAGDEATILHTEDDGRTWKSQHHSRVALNSIAFSTRENGCAVGDGGTMWHSEDGGSKWSDVSPGISDDLSQVAFASPRTGWAVGDKGLILRTSDGGYNWKRQLSNADQSLRAVAFVSTSSAWVVGDGGTILHTEDGGETWKQQTSGTPAGLMFVAFPTPQSGWATGSDGVILHTADGGGKWEAQKSGTAKNLYGISFVSSRSGWIVGEMGAILHTEDAGQHWIEQEAGIRAGLSEVSFISPKSGWAVTSAGGILHTLDGGHTWVTQSSGSRAALRSISVLKPYGKLGVQLKTQQAKSSLPATAHGAEVTQVSPGGPASKAGLKVGDVIVAVNGDRVESNGDLMERIYALKPGANATLTYTRGGKIATINVVPADGSKPGP